MGAAEKVLPTVGGAGRKWYGVGMWAWPYDNDDTKVRDYQNAKQQAGNENA